MFELNTAPPYRVGQHRALRPRFELLPVFAGLALFGFAAFYTAHFAVDKFDYRVAGSHLVCQQPLNNRCATHYTIQKAGEWTSSDYTIFGYQFADGDLRAGNEVRKLELGFVYSVNGRVETWSYGSEMALWVAGALVALF